LKYHCPQADWMTRGIKVIRKVTFTNLLTADQVVMVYRFAGMVKKDLPRKGMKRVLSVPAPNMLLIEIRIAEQKSTYDRKMYLCEHIEYKCCETHAEFGGNCK
jgi:hypothetical protein